jgi:hypothetical protein
MTESVPVEIVAPDPIPVEVIHPVVPTRHGVQQQETDPSVRAKTTFQEDLTTAGQRQINLIWERTQSAIALAVVMITMIASIVGMMRNLVIPNLVAVAFGTVIGFYFSRTNHAAIGGIGTRPPEQKYEGR